MNRSNLMRSLLYMLALGLLAIVYMSYFAPEMMVSFTNQIWAMCGW